MADNSWPDPEALFFTEQANLLQSGPKIAFVTDPVCNAERSLLLHLQQILSEPSRDSLAGSQLDYH